MSFLHGYLLGGLVLVGVPILVHLIMRQKPKRLLFPAFRFLKQRHLTSRRKIQLQHLLLMALRMLVIAALCLGLARPRLVTGRASFGADRPVAAVLLVDTSMSMEYNPGEATRLDEARRRAAELIEETSPESRIALLDTGDDGTEAVGQEWIPTRSLVQSRLSGLRLRPASGPVSRHLDRAFRLLQTADQGEDAPPRFLYVFSDRTQASWDAAEIRNLAVPEGVNVVYVDVGVDSPIDLSIDEVKVEPSVVPPGGKMVVRATLRATGRDFDAVVTCALDNEPDPNRQPDKKQVKLAKGEAREVEFERPAPSPRPGPYGETPLQATVKLEANDALPYNNTRPATFVVREGRNLLTLTDSAASARIWKAALQAVGSFRADVRVLAESGAPTLEELKKYRVVTLFQVASPPEELWTRLHDFVRAGGGLLIVPGGDDLNKDRYNDDRTAMKLLPGTFGLLEKVDPKKDGVPWADFGGQHPVTAPLRKWRDTANPDFAREELRPRASGYWRVEPVDRDVVKVAVYADGQNPPSPALLERNVGTGRVLLFTTPLDGGNIPGTNRAWNNYWSQSTFGLVLADLVCSYLAGDTGAAEYNFLSGQTVTVQLPSPPPAGPLTLSGPGLTAAEASLTVPEGQTRLLVTRAVEPGNFTVKEQRDKQNVTVAGFSLNVRPEEAKLDRVPPGDVEAILGKGTVYATGQGTSLKDQLQSHYAPPMDLLPWLMIALLFALTVESLLANRFYRHSDQATPS